MCAVLFDFKRLQPDLPDEVGCHDKHGCRAVNIEMQVDFNILPIG